MRRLAPKTVILLAAVGVTGGAWAALIPWDMRNRTTYPGSIEETTPISLPAAVCFAVFLLAVAAVLGWLRWAACWAAIVATGAPAALMMASFRTHPILDADPWPVAWVFFTALMLAGCYLAALAPRVLRARRHSTSLKTAH